MTTYTQLGTDLTSYAHQDLSSMLPRFVALVESRLNRVLRVRQMEEPAAGTIASGEIALPADYVDTKTLYVEGYEGSPLNVATLEHINSSDIGSVANAYAVTDTAWKFNGTGTVAGTYYKAIPGLQANTTNWLSVLAFDLYLSGVLEEAYRYTRDGALMAQESARFSNLVSELNRGAYKTGALQSRRA